MEKVIVIDTFQRKKIGVIEFDNIFSMKKFLEKSKGGDYKYYTESFYNKWTQASC